MVPEHLERNFLFDFHLIVHLLLTFLKALQIDCLKKFVLNFYDVKRQLSFVGQCLGKEARTPELGAGGLYPPHLFAGMLC